MTDFGRDISCTDGIRTGRFSVGPRLVAEACYRRLTTPRGTLRGGEDEQNYGLDLSELIGSSSSAAEAATLPGKITLELSKDERLTSVDVQVIRTVEGPATSLEIAVAGTTDEGPFTLVLKASEVTVEILGLTS